MRAWVGGHCWSAHSRQRLIAKRGRAASQTGTSPYYVGTHKQSSSPRAALFPSLAVAFDLFRRTSSLCRTGCPPSSPSPLSAALPARVPVHVPGGRMTLSTSQRSGDASNYACTVQKRSGTVSAAMAELWSISQPGMVHAQSIPGTMVRDQVNPAISRPHHIQFLCSPSGNPFHSDLRASCSSASSTHVLFPLLPLYQFIPYSRLSRFVFATHSR